MSRSRSSTTSYVFDVEAVEYLRELSKLTRVPQSAIVRQLVNVETLRAWAREHWQLEAPRALLAASASESEVEASDPLPELQARRRWG